MNALLQLSGVTKRFPGATQAALEDVSFDVYKGELLTLIGASGSGKTSLLRIVAGLEAPDTGEVRLGNALLTSGHRILVPPEQRHVGFVFQNHALFPHLKVRDNVAFGLGHGRRDRARVAELLDMVNLAEVAGRYPHQLSGGERQRVALVRALAPQPSLLLMDEPFSSLDYSLREGLREETRRLIRQAGATTLFVTHDAEDALAVSDRIAVLREGRILQIGTPPEIYHRPADRDVARSFGPCNFLVVADFATPLRLAACRGIQPEGLNEGELWVRPEDLTLANPGHADSLVEGVVRDSLYHGDSHMLTIECQSRGGKRFNVLVRRQGAEGNGVGERYSLIPATRPGS